MDPLWLIDYLRSRQDRFAPGETSDILTNRTISDILFAGQLLSGDWGGAVGGWVARQASPAVEAFLTQQLQRAGLNAATAGLLGTLGAPLLLGGVLGRLFRRRPTAKPSDTGYMLNQQRAAVFQNAANRALQEAVDTAQHRAQGMLGTAQSLAGSNQYLGTMLSQGVAPSVAETMSQIVQQGLQTKAQLAREALDFERRRHASAVDFGRQLHMNELEAQRQRRNMMMQMMLAMMLPQREGS